ncbi:hypothetical protein BJ165DRAFT_1404288 [Panaeolus papilionaceus]|nr:hypothetical protein BJ165DRAFT_1404288 [Panaeolus papilionaceus]
MAFTPQIVKETLMLDPTPTTLQSSAQRVLEELLQEGDEFVPPTPSCKLSMDSSDDPSLGTSLEVDEEGVVDLRTALHASMVVFMNLTPAPVVTSPREISPREITPLLAPLIDASETLSGAGHNLEKLFINNFDKESTADVCAAILLGQFLDELFPCLKEVGLYEDHTRPEATDNVMMKSVDVDWWRGIFILIQTLQRSRSRRQPKDCVD